MNGRGAGNLLVWEGGGERAGLMQGAGLQGYLA